MYTISEVAAICGCSRSTLMRLEDAGFLTPRSVNPETGYRKYDLENVLRVQLYQMFRDMGLSQKDVLTYYSGDSEREAFLEALVARRDALTRCIDLIRAKNSPRDRLSFTFEEMPGVDYYAVGTDIAKLTERDKMAVETYTRAIKEGFRPSPNLPFVSVTPDFDSVYDGGAETPFRALQCVPVKTDPCPEPTRVGHIEPCKVFSMIYHGEDREIINRGGELLLEEMRRRGIQPKGPLFSMAVSGPLEGNDVQPEDYVFRFAVPVECG